MNTTPDPPIGRTQPDCGTPHSTPASDGSAFVGLLCAALHADLIETHISWVLLAGKIAYKIKKPVRLAFVDYGNLQARRHFCEEERSEERRVGKECRL